MSEKNAPELILRLPLLTSPSRTKSDFVRRIGESKYISHYESKTVNYEIQSHSKASSLVILAHWVNSWEFGFFGFHAADANNTHPPVCTLISALSISSLEHWSFY